VAVVDGGVGLDDLVDLEAVRRLDLALEGAHDPGGDSSLEPEGVSDRDDGVPDLDGARVPERQGSQRASPGALDLEDGDVRGGIGADDGRVARLVVGEADLDR